MVNVSSELFKRVITATVGASALILLVIFGGYVGICLLTAVLSLGMVSEYAEITLALEDRKAKKYFLLILTWFIAVANVIIPVAEFELLTFCFLALFTYYLFTSNGREGQEFLDHFRELKYSLFGLVYLAFLPLYLTRIRAGANGLHWVILFFLIVWAGDTFAYFAGKKYGKTKLYRHISPKKTREGALGGLAGGVLVAAVYKLALFRDLGWGGVIFVPIIVGAVAQVGDLCESFLKRVYGKKDSGTILPGHGGFLDRFDSVVFSVPVMYACMRIWS